VTGSAESWPRGLTWVARLLVASLAFNLLSGNSAGVGLPVPPDRILLLAALALLVLGERSRHLGRLRWRAVHGVMVAAVLWTVWSALVHGTLQGSYGFFALLDRLVIPFVLFTLAPVIFAREEERRLLLRLFVVLGVYLGLTAVFEIVGPHALVFPRYVMDPDVGIMFGRARGPQAQAEANGLVLALCFFASILSASRSRGAWRAASLASAALSALGILLTLTRSVWLGTVLGALVLVILVPSLWRRAVPVAAGTAGTLGAVVLSIPGLTTALVERFTTSRSVYDRQNTNEAALRIVAEHPLDGIGWTKFLVEGTDWVRQADGYPITNVDIEVHNVVLSRAAELGLVGAALWAACVLAGPALAVLRRPAESGLDGWRLVFIGYACVWGVCIMVSPVPYVLPNNILWLLAGLLLRDHLTWRRPAPDTGAGPEGAPAGLPGATGGGDRAPDASTSAGTPPEIGRRGR
jgi:putative inorganic carbon (hco3(-)) transporter